MSVLSSQQLLMKHDRWLLSCLTWVPVLLAVTIWWIFSQGIARELPVGVVDLSHSQLSRQLIRELNASPTLLVNHAYQSTAEAKNALITNEVYAYVVIPYQIDKSLYRSEQPQVTTFYNSQYILVARLINSAVLAAQGTFNARADIVRNLSAGNQSVSGATSRAVPVRTQMTALFNLNTNYAQFLVSAIVPALWQIFIVVSTILILAANHRVYGLSSWLGQRAARNLIVTLSPYLPLFMLQGIGFLLWFYQGLEWPFQGSLVPVIAAQALTTIACVIMGAFFFFLTLDAARAMSFAGAFTAPSFAFMGITFPVTDMGHPAQIWRSLLPISHYIEVQVDQASYAIPGWQSLERLWPMAGYLLPALLVLLLAQRHLSRDAQAGE